MSKRNLVLFLSLLLVVSCAGRGAAPQLAEQLELGTEQVGQTDLGGTPLPALPQGLPTRTAVTALAHTFAEIDEYAASAGANWMGGFLGLPAGEDEWAILGVALPGAEVTGIEIGGVCQGMYVAVSDFDANRWRWQPGPIDQPTNIELPDGNYLSDDDSFYVAVYCPDQSSAHTRITVNFDGESDGGIWNLMVWIAADNDLAWAGVLNINQMEEATKNENINLLVGCDIDADYVGGAVSGIDQVHYMKVVDDTNPAAIITDGHPANQSFPRAGYNSADPAKLVEFVNWCDTNFPAEHTILVLWNHGDGWRDVGAGGAAGAGGGVPGYRGASTVRETSGILSDYTEGGWALTSNSAIVEALSGSHFDAIMFDACNMGQMEALHEYTGLASWLVASEVLVPGEGYAYTPAINEWTARYPISAEIVGDIFVDTAQAYYTTQGEYMNHAVFPSTGVAQLVSSLGSLATAVTPKAEAEGEAVRSAAAASYVPWSGSGTRDLKDFLVAYRAATTDTQIQALLDTSLQIHDATVMHYNHYLREMCHGVAVYLPDKSFVTPGLKEEYRQLPFNQTTGWLEMLEATGVTGGGGTGENWEPGDYVELTWVQHGADFDLEVWDPLWNWGAPWDPDGLAGVISFSPESDGLTIQLESGELLAGGSFGAYNIDVTYYTWLGDGSPPASLNAFVDLYAGDGTLKRNLASLVFNGSNEYTTQEAAQLTR